MAELNDNRSKLASATGAVAKHLFVWIHNSSYAASNAVSFDPSPPLGIVDLGADVDVLWVAAPMVLEVEDIKLLWRCRHGGHWQDITEQVRRTHEPPAE